jgi:hypothetical protein
LSRDPTGSHPRKLLTDQTRYFIGAVRRNLITRDGSKPARAKIKTWQAMGAPSSSPYRSAAPINLSAPLVHSPFRRHAELQPLNAKSP